MRFLSPSSPFSRTGLLLIAALLTVAGMVLATSEPASAAVLRYKVISKTSTKNATGSVIASCKITSNGGTCSISRGKSVSRTIGVSLGVSRSEVSAALSISSAASVTTTVACSSPALKAGQAWKARGLGTRYTYKVQKQQGFRPRVGPLNWKTVGTSSTLTAFNPSANSISCGL